MAEAPSADTLARLATQRVVTAVDTLNRALDDYRKDTGHQMPLRVDVWASVDQVYELVAMPAHTDPVPYPVTGQVPTPTLYCGASLDQWMSEALQLHATTPDDDDALRRYGKIVQAQRARLDLATMAEIADLRQVLSDEYDFITHHPKHRAAAITEQKRSITQYIQTLAGL